MIIRGRSLALFLASALPLLAEDGLSPKSVTPSEKVVDTSTIKGGAQPLNIPKVDLVDDDENDENNVMSYTASEAIHNDGFRLPPLATKEVTLTLPTSHDNIDEDRDSLGQGMESSINVSVGLTREQASHDAQNSKSKESIDVDKKRDDDVRIEPHAPSAKYNGSNRTENDSKINKSTIPEDGREKENYEEEAKIDLSKPVMKDAIKTVVRSLSDLENQNDPEGSKVESSIEEEDEEVSLSRVLVDYASKSAGALIIEKSSGFKGTSNLLNADKDRYAIAPCEEKKFVVISLSEDILVKQIKLSNYERFSSSVKDFQIMGSQTLGKWFDLGTYSATPGNGEQAFDLAEPAWARYLKFKFLSHHGVEYYCTCSQIQVHGSTMVQGFHEQWEESEEKENEELVAEKARKLSVDNRMQGHGSLTDDSAANVPHNENSDKLSIAQTQTQPSLSGYSSDAVSLAGARHLSYSSQLDNKLHGALLDGDLLASLYDLIPSTLNALPMASRNSPGRHTASGELRTLHQIGSLTTQSIFSTSRTTATAAKSLVCDTSASISTPRMTDRMGDIINQYLGTELGLLTSKWIYSDLQEPKSRSDKEVIEMANNQSETNGDDETDLVSNQGATAKSDPAKEGAESKEKSTEGEIVFEDPPANESFYSQQERDHSLGSDLSNAAESSMDMTLAKMLENFPSAECLYKLELSEVKVNMNTSKKTHGGSGTSASSGSNPMEPIFKKLTDEIRSLQSSLSAHDQFTKTSVTCYQRVILDLIVAMERLRSDNDQRLRNLETDFRESQASIMWKISRSVFQSLRILSSCIYSMIVHIYSPLLVWFSSLGKGCLRIPGMVYRQALLRWPAVKGIILSNGDGLPPALANLLRLFTEQMDHLLLEMELADSHFTPEDADVIAKENDEMWKFPVLPIVLMILVGRLVMCFANPSIRVSKFSAKSGTTKLMSSGKSTFKDSPVKAAGQGKKLAEDIDNGISRSSQPVDESLLLVDVANQKSSQFLSEARADDSHPSHNERPLPSKRVSRRTLPQRRSILSPRNGS